MEEKQFVHGGGGGHRCSNWAGFASSPFYACFGHLKWQVGRVGPSTLLPHRGPVPKCDDVCMTLICLGPGGGGSSFAPARSNKHCELRFVSLCLSSELLVLINEAPANESYSLCGGVVFCVQEMLLSRLKGKGHSITCHRMHRAGDKGYFHTFLTSSPERRGWSTPCPGKKPQDRLSPGAPEPRSLTDMENRISLASTGVGSPDSPARS